MSTNIHWAATRWVIVERTGERVEQCDYFDPVYQTPTAVTQRIMASTDPAAEYKRWVLETFTRTELENVYADDDVFCENEPIGTRVVNLAEQHCAAFNSWINLMTTAGYDIKPEAW